MASDTLTRSDSLTPSGSSVASTPFLDLKAQFAEIRDEVLKAVTGVLESQHFILGPEGETV
jgi:hypothetical protein